MDDKELLIPFVRLLAAAAAGGLIGLERSYHGRPAGFRTHTLVCMASSLLMLVTVFQWELLTDAPLETIRVDPTRMAQGIMTGIGFLGAGVILKEHLTIRGLTTAASIWLTAAIGIVIGMGMYFAAILSTLLALAILVVFRHMERRLRTMRYARLTLRFNRHHPMTEKQVRTLADAHDVEIGGRFSYKLENEGKLLQYQVTIHTLDSANFRRLAETLTETDQVLEFAITPTGE
ncbi:MAG TPA: MgtC/SapB family protein [Gammaproteobacteria bacterium]|nr:MgtC/SapB family protein [Gammaproteobacteria bacterium]